MNITMVSNFCGQLMNDNSRIHYIANILSKEHNVEILTSDFNHITKKHDYDKRKLTEYRVTFVHECGYKKNVSLTRFLSHMQWGVRAYRYLKNEKQPDVVYCAVPSLTAAYLIGKYCRRKGIKFVIDIQDLWPEAFEMIINFKKMNRVFYFPFYFLADSIYKYADVVLAVSDTYIKRALEVNHVCNRTAGVYLGTELSEFDNDMESVPFSKSQSDVVMGYCGTLGSSYDLCGVIDALYYLQKEGIKPPRFVVMGDGPQKSIFQNHANELNVDVEFIGRLPYNNMCWVLTQMDFVINPITDRSAASIINKHADYAAAGKAVINTQNSDEYRKLIEKYNMGINCENGNVRELAEAIHTLSVDSQMRENMGRSARKCAVDCFDRASTYGRLIDLIVY